MPNRRWSLRPFFRGTAVFGIAAVAVAAPFGAASAQSMFDFLFGPPKRPSPPASASFYADPSSPQYNSTGRPSEPSAQRVESGPAVSYCVRLCDGRYFPIQRSAATPVQVCSSFCPAAKTKVFSGGGIDHATAHDGTRYSDLPNAFAYRKSKIENCTCNGKDAYGLVNMKAAEDPTLRPGDIVATDSGLVAYSGGSSGRKRNAEFTPVESYSGLSADMRRKLSETRVRPTISTPASAVAPAATPISENKRVQLER